MSLTELHVTECNVGDCNIHASGKERCFWPEVTNMMILEYEYLEPVLMVFIITYI